LETLESFSDQFVRTSDLFIRALRNVAAHEYAADDVDMLYQEVVSLTPTILDITSLL